MNTKSLLTKRFQVTIDYLIEGHVHALELRDKETRGHAQRVAILAFKLAQNLGIKGEALLRLYRGALLHDIGKIAIPDDVLLKPDRLSQTEWDIMRTHPGFANDLLLQNSLLSEFCEIPFCHHEHWDGNGYPRGLKGDDIPISSRIFTVVDVWDALISDRPYRTAWSQEDAKKYIQTNAGILFDDRIVDMFIYMLKNHPDTYLFQPNMVFEPRTFH